MLQHTEAAKRFYKSKAWQQCRQSYIAMVHGLCERCEQPGLILHHKIYIDSKNINDPSITLNHDNLEYLCQTCHNREHFKRNSAIRDGFGFDSAGNLIVLEDE